MTFIKRNKALALLLALLMMLAMLAAGIGFSASADDNLPTFKLAVTYDESTATVYYSLNDGSEKKLDSGREYDINRGDKVKLIVRAASGYTVKGAGGLFEIIEGGVELQRIANKESGTIDYIIERYNQNHYFVARCINRTFDIDFYPSVYATGSDLDYDFEQNTDDLSVTYMSGAVSIPRPIKDGYEFVNWTVVSSSGAVLDGLAPISDTLQLNNSQLLAPGILETGMIYLRANFIPKQFLVTRFDYVYDTNADNYRGEELGRYSAMVDMDSILNSATWGGAEGSDPGANGYLGYKLREGSSNHSIKVNITNSEHPFNILRRFYDPIVYTLRFDANGGSSVAAGSHTFNANTTLPASERLGYVFVGWTVIVDGVEVGVVRANGSGDYILEAKNTAYAANNVDAETGLPLIELRAKWEAERYALDFNVSGGALAQGTPNVHVYDASGDNATAIPDPIRRGYQFEGWYINGSTELSLSKDGYFILDPHLMPLDGTDSITLVAVWTVKTYQITLSGNAGSDFVNNLASGYSATFDETVAGISITPSRVGYRFCGFSTEENGGTFYIDENGNGIGTWQEDGVTTLYAQWEALPYSIVISTNNSEYVEYVKINGELYTLEEVYTIKFRETVSVQVVTKNGYKLVMWMGGAQAHSADFTVSYSHLIDEQKNIVFIVLPVVESPSFAVDYENETIVVSGDRIPAGKYSVYDSTGNLWRKIDVSANGIIKLDGVEVSAINIPEIFFGTTITIVRHDVDGLYADSDPISLPIAARPAAPSISLEISAYHKEILVKVLSSDSSILYQYAISRTASAEDLVWQDSNVFENLEPGTPYYVHVRIKHTGSAPHSIPMSAVATQTKHDAYLLEVQGRLDALKQSGDGTNVDAVIRAAKDAIAVLAENAPYDSFHDDVEQVIEAAKQAIPLARTKDRAIAELKAKAEALKGGNAYNENGELEIDGILAGAIDEITNATDADAVKTLQSQAGTEMGGVKITYITAKDPSTSDSVKVTCNGGIAPDSKLTLTRYPNLTELSEKLDAAIAAGKVTVYGDGLTVASVIEALGTQDAMAAFRLALVSRTAGTDSYELRFLIPTDLKNVQALQVGYYNEETGTLEILASRIEGDYLVFSSDRIADFVLFGDPTVKLTAAIAVLGATLLLQIVAIVILLASRKKAMKHARTRCVAPVAVLTIRFLPINGVAIVVALAAAVVLCTFILVWLLLTTDIKKKGDALQTEPAPDQAPADTAPEAEDQAMSVFDDDYRENDPAPAVLGESNAIAEGEDADFVGDANEEEYQYAYDAEGEEPLAEDAYEESAAYEEDPFAVYDDEATDQSFIEPAVNPMYSLPDEEGYEEYEVAEGDEGEEWATLDPEAESFDAEVLDDQASLEEYSDEVYYVEDSELVYVGDEDYEAVEADGATLTEYDPAGEELSDDGEIVYEEVYEDAYEEGEFREDAPEEDELSDIDDSYLADLDDGEEILPDIDDSHLAE